VIVLYDHSNARMTLEWHHLSLSVVSSTKFLYLTGFPLAEGSERTTCTIKFP